VIGMSPVDDGVIVGSISVVRACRACKDGWDRDATNARHNKPPVATGPTRAVPHGDIAVRRGVAGWWDLLPSLSVLCGFAVQVLRAYPSPNESCSVDTTTHHAPPTTPPRAPPRRPPPGPRRLARPILQPALRLPFRREGEPLPTTPSTIRVATCRNLEADGVARRWEGTSLMGAMSTQSVCGTRIWCMPADFLPPNASPSPRPHTRPVMR
jgi:hypothetical protein